jgi:hypothetical protein
MDHSLHKRSVIIFWAGLVLGLLGCFVLVLFAIATLYTGKADRSGQAAHDIKITLERGPCFGFCPVYVLSVDEDGTVKVDGQIYKGGKPTGLNTTYRISSDKVTKLIAEFNKVEFFKLDDEYRDPLVTDLPSTEITYSVDGKTKRVYLYGLANTVPAKLAALADQIDLITGAKELLVDAPVSSPLN